MSRKIIVLDNKREKYSWTLVSRKRKQRVSCGIYQFLPPAYVVRRKGNVLTRVCLSTGGGVPVSHNALQHFPECHGAAGGVPCQVQPGGVPCPGGYPARSSRGGTLAGGGYLGRGSTLAGGYPAGGYPGWGGYLGRGVPWPGGYPGRGVPWPGGYPVRTT